MKDEIKEILDTLKYCVEKNEYLEVPNMKEWKPLLDYITNLQEENKILRQNAENNDKVVDKARWNEMLYKGRIDKVIHKIQFLQMDGEVSIKDLGLIVRDLQGSDKDD